MAGRGERLVLTNGCFDLVHAGHVRYLRQARALGDALAVGLNSDRSVRRLKGAGRPVATEEDRAEVLVALECVDFVTVFDEDTADELVAEVKPDVYVKGGDYSADPESPLFPAEGHLVQSYGGAVRVVEYLPGRSTTELLERARSPRTDRPANE
jgi:rfaE bifunctional protein nucleotidyltransferase chain/domain